MCYAQRIAQVYTHIKEEVETMALPKGKVSKARGRSRRANWKLAAPSIVSCPRCHEMKRTHRVCPKCGYYADLKVLELDEDKKK